MKNQKKVFKLLTSGVFALAMTACATQNKTAGLGSLIGATGGAAIGGIVDPGKNGEYRTRNVIIGATVGGLVGLVAGSNFHEEIKAREEAAYTKGRASAPQPQMGAVPSMKNASVESRWIEGRVVGNRYIEGHFEHTITEPTRWDVQ
jgi:hypothetical protein